VPVPEQSVREAFMELARLPRWNWLVIGLITGLVVGLTRAGADGPLHGLDVQGYGLLLSDQQQFEDGLMQDYNGIRLFSDPVVYPHWVPDSNGRKKLVYIVAGGYWDGRTRRQGNQLVGDVRPRCVITHTPYRPKIGIAGADGATAQEFPSVREFLDALGKRYGVHYRYAWWAAYPVSSWTLASLVLIGGIWPTLVNLLTYGTWRRPPEVRPISLWNVRGVRKTAQTPTPVLADFPLGDADESAVGSDAAAAPSEVPAGAPVRAMAGGPVETLPDAETEAKEFGAREDDYYPTERHTAGTRTPH
jgi:hypothetical protein